MLFILFLSSSVGVAGSFFISFIPSFPFSFFFSGSWRLFIRGGLPSSRCDVSIPERGFFPVALSFPPGRWRWCQVGGACLFFWWSRSLVCWIYIRLLQTTSNGDIDSSTARLHRTSGAPSSKPHPCIAVFLQTIFYKLQKINVDYLWFVVHFLYCCWSSAGLSISFVGGVGWYWVVVYEVVFFSSFSPVFMLWFFYLSSYSLYLLYCF